MGQNCPHVFNILILYAISPLIVHIITWYLKGRWVLYGSKQIRSFNYLATVEPEVSQSHYWQSCGQFCPFTQKYGFLAREAHPRARIVPDYCGGCLETIKKFSTSRHQLQREFHPFLLHGISAEMGVITKSCIEDGRQGPILIRNIVDAYMQRVSCEYQSVLTSRRTKISTNHQKCIFSICF